MHALLLRPSVRKIGSLQSFNEYRQFESSQQLSSVTSDGLLLEYETLELRLHPPNVQIDNETYDDVTVITIDSANRPGTLIEVVQCLTELGLSIRRARISSDGGWFVDEFFVTETPKGKVQDARKLDLIRRLLSVDSEAHQGIGSCSVFELSGRDSSGLLVSVLQLLVSSDCEVTSAAVWTFQNRCALVVSVTERGAPIADAGKGERLQATLRGMLGGEDAVVKLEMVRGDIHHERRLHHLLLLEELRSWEEQQHISNQLRLQIDEPASLVAGTTAAASCGGSAGGASATAGGGNRTSATGGGPGEPAAGLGPTGPRRSGSWSSVASGNIPTGVTAGGPSISAGSAAAAGGGTGPASGSDTPNVRPNSASPVTTTAPSPSAVPSFERSSASGPRATNPGASPIAPAPTASLSLDPVWDSSVPHSPRHMVAAPAEVKIQHSPILNYWLVTIASKDRNKLFFDTVCTFADLNYDVYHSTIDSEGESASQLFYVRPRYGEAIWDAQRAHKLKYMLESAVQRRFPKGLKIHVQATDQRSLLDLFQQLSAAGFWVTRAEVRCHQDVAVYNFSLTDNLGQIPPQNVLQRTCEMAGGVLVDDLDQLHPSLSGGQGGAAGGAAASAAAVLSRSETFPVRQLQAAVAAGMPLRLSGNCRFAFCFLDKRTGVSSGTLGMHKA